MLSEFLKDYLSINSTTQDDRIANVLNYATGMVEHYIGHAGVCCAERRSKLMAEARHDMVVIYFETDFAVFCMQGARTSITTDLGENEYNEAEDNVGTR